MAETVYALCALFSLTCAVLLFRSYRVARSQLLLWSSLSFSFLALNNLVLFLDLDVFPNVDFGGVFIRYLFGAVAGSVLLFGLILELL